MNSRVAVVGRRMCAVLAACSGALHGISIVNAGNMAVAALTGGMGLVCLYCARELWMQGALRAWTLVAVMNIAMIAVHAPFASGHQHGGSVAVAAMPTHHSTAMTAATVLAAVEALIATAVIYRLSRHNRLRVLGIR
jgi:hypothetical protein